MTEDTGAPDRSRIIGGRTRRTDAGAPGGRPGARPFSPERIRTPGDDMAGWVHRGACRTSEPELFFPTSTTGRLTAIQQIAKAKAVCRGCPVIDSCRAWALAHPRMSEHGIWAAMSEEERRADRRRVDRSGRRAQRPGRGERRGADPRDQQAT